MQTDTHSSEYWQALADDTGLRYIPRTNNGNSIPRLIGMKQQYLIYIVYGAAFIMGKRVGAYYIAVRYRTTHETDLLLQALEQNTILHQTRVASKLDKMPFIVDEDLCIIPIRSYPRKDTIALVTQALSEIINTLHNFVIPPKPNTCMNEDCASNHQQNPNIIIAENLPQLLCPACVDKIRNAGIEQHEAYESAPQRLDEVIKIAVRIGGIVFAISTAVTFFLPDLVMIASFMSMIVFVQTLTAMHKREIALYPNTVWVVGCISALSTILSTLLMVGISVAVESQTGWAIESEFGHSILILGSIFISTLMTGVVATATLRDLRKNVNRITRPDIEVFELE